MSCDVTWHGALLPRCNAVEVTRATGPRPPPKEPAHGLSHQGPVGGPAALSSGVEYQPVLVVMVVMCGSDAVNAMCVRMC